MKGSSEWWRAVENDEEYYSGGFRNLEKGGTATGARSASENFGVAKPTSSHVNIRTEYLEATLGLVNRLEISKELIHECVTVLGCCCCIPLLYNHLMGSCSYLRKKTLLAAVGGAFAPTLPPSKSAAGSSEWWRVVGNDEW